MAILFLYSALVLASAEVEPLHFNRASYWFSLSESVARVQVSTRQRLELDYGEGTCGWLYRAQVLESLKGTAPELSFVGSEPPSMAVGSEYLVFIQSVPPEEVQPFLEALRPDPETRRLMACQLKASPNSAGRESLTVIPISRSAAGEAILSPVEPSRVLSPLKAGMLWSEAMRLLRSK